MATAAVQLLETLTSCLSSVGSSLPKAKREEPSDVSIEPPQDGISLLDTKNELLLSYLHNLVFLIIIQLRELSSSKEQDDENKDTESIQEEVVKKLIELRVYLDKGVRPLEGRLKYQVDKVIKAAEDAERADRDAAGSKKSKSKSKKAAHANEDDSASDEDVSDSEGSIEDDDEEDMDEMAFRPNVKAFAKNVESQAQKQDKTTKNASTDGIYRPPKIMPTALPSEEKRRDREERRMRKSNVIDEFVAAEMSSAPMAEASIGSTIRQGGRHSKTRKEREYENERRTYEETNFVRLPKESKKERAKRGANRPQSTFGGEEWRGLGEGVDRIERLTRRAKGSGGALDKSRKRKVTEDGRDDGIGHVFEKRRKKIESWKK